MIKMNVKIFSIVFLASFFIHNLSFAADYEVARGIIDLHSTASDGLYPVQRIVEMAHDKGVRILIFADYALRKWEYGLWPFRGIIKKTYTEPSVLRLGGEEYARIFENLKKEFSDSVVIPGLEVSPFYYWQGLPFSRSFSLNDWNKEFIIIGLKPQDYRNIPLIGNRSKYKQYSGSQGIGPYQDVIDYVEKRGGFIFWAHPEMETHTNVMGIDIYSQSHFGDLFLSHGYTGFGVTYSDRISMADTGGDWDKLLLEYAEGRREKPVWIIAAVHFERDLNKLDSAETLFFLNNITEAAVLEALEEGRMYVRFNLGPEKVVLNEFKVTDSRKGVISIFASGSSSGSASSPVTIDIIRNGKLLKTVSEPGQEWSISIEDTLLPKISGKLYYRLKIKGPGSLILTNPLFVNIK